MEAADASSRVEVVYALPERQWISEVRLGPGSTVRDAIISSGILQNCPEIELEKAQVGVWNKRAALDHIVCDGDRVEIYRPLLADPKEARRRRAGRRGGNLP